MLDLELLNKRHEVPDEALTAHIAQNFSGSLLSLRQLAPFVAEIRRRFKILPRKRGVDGQHKTISGCRTFKSFCETVLHRKPRTVRHALRGLEILRTEKEAPSKAAIIAALARYIARRCETLNLSVFEREDVYDLVEQETQAKGLSAIKREDVYILVKPNGNT